MDGRGERRFHHRHALAAREREPHRHQCRGCSGRPGFHLLLLQKLIALRKELPVFRDGRFTLLCLEDEQLFAYTRDTETEHLLVVCNFSGREASFDFPAEYRGAECLVSNYKEPSVQTIRPYEAWMLIKKEC